MQIVSTAAMVITNILQFQQEIVDNFELQSRLSYARAWYAYKDSNGNYFFGFSKYIGYAGSEGRSLTGAEYIEESEELDGRKTEAQLQQWFDVVKPGTPLYQQLRSELFAFLGRYGKTPSTMVRINILRPEFYDYVGEGDELPDPNDAIVDLIVTVARALPAAQFERLQARLR